MSPRPAPALMYFARLVSLPFFLSFFLQEHIFVFLPVPSFIGCVDQVTMAGSLGNEQDVQRSLDEPIDTNDVRRPQCDVFVRTNVYTYIRHKVIAGYSCAHERTPTSRTRARKT